MRPSKHVAHVVLPFLTSPRATLGVLSEQVRVLLSNQEFHNFTTLNTPVRCFGDARRELSECGDVLFGHFFESCPCLQTQS